MQGIATIPLETSELSSPKGWEVSLLSGLIHGVKTDCFFHILIVHVIPQMPQKQALSSWKCKTIALV